MNITTSIHSVTAITTVAEKAAQAGKYDNPYAPDTVAHYVYKNAFEIEKTRVIKENSSKPKNKKS